MSKSSALAAAKAANKIKTAGVPAAQVPEVTDSKVENPVETPLEVAETVNPTDGQQSSITESQSPSSSEVNGSTNPTEEISGESQPQKSSQTDSINTPGDRTDDIDFDAISAQVDAAVSAQEATPDSTPIDPLQAELNEIEELQSMVGKPTEEVKATDKIKGGEKNPKTPNPNAGTGGGGARGKAVWLMLQNIPDQPAHIGPVTLTAAYETALGIVNGLKAKNVILQRDGERGMDRFWHNGEMRIFYSATDPSKGEVEAPTPVRTGGTKAPRESGGSKKAKESGPVEQLSAKELLAQQKAQKLLEGSGEATPVPTVPDDDALSAVIGTLPETDENEASEGSSVGEGGNASVPSTDSIDGNGDGNDAVSESSGLPWQ